MEVLATLAVMLGASWCAGINLYATVGMLGLMSRYSSFHTKEQDKSIPIDPETIKGRDRFRSA